VQAWPGTLDLCQNKVIKTDIYNFIFFSRIKSKFKLVAGIALAMTLTNCAGNKPMVAEPKAMQAQQGNNLHKALEEVSCPGANDFRGMGIGASESEALAQARANMAQEHFAVKLKSDIDIRAQDIDGMASSHTQASISQEAKLLNPNDAKLHHSARQGDKVGAVACMSRADFAAFYDKMMEAAFGEARRNIEFSRKLMEEDRKKDALEKLGDSRKYVDTLAYHRSVLRAMGIERDSEGVQGEQISELLKEIAAMQIELERSALVFVTGTESIQDQAIEIIIPKLQTMLSENNIKVAEKQEEASHILSIDAKVCNTRSDEHFRYASACVKVTFTNAKTGKNEITITVNGRKEGALNEYNAGERAFRSAAAEVWTKIKDKILEVCL